MHRLVGATDEAGMMRVTYLGPMMMANKHPVAAELKEQAFPASCFAVEVCSASTVAVRALV